MFDFAISRQKWRPPSRRLMKSGVVSIISHLLVFVVLNENPHVLLPGLRPWVRPAPSLKGALPDKEWRTVTFVERPGSMRMPSAEVLRELIYDWNRDPGKGSGRPPIPIRWGDETVAAAVQFPEPVPRVLSPEGSPLPVPEVAAAKPPNTADPERGGSPEGKQVTVYLPPPSGTPTPAKIPETIPASEPTKVAAERMTAPATEPRQEARVFQDRQAAMRTEGSGLFDTKGFPLGDYATIIIEKVKGNWLIPSNLRNSQGRTTIVFFIRKDGTFVNAQIVSPSGSSSLDIAALSAIIGSNPFPPLPEGFPGDRVGAKFVFAYNERP